ncbi:MAG: hypothetical protein ACMV1B_09660 [Prevotella sp.]
MADSTWVSVLDSLQVTDGTLTGNGIFDTWMRALGAHLKREYAEQRITGDEYAKAYIALMNNLLNAAVGFLTQDAQLAMAKEKLAYELQLLDAQVKLANKELAIKDKDLELKEKQVALAEAQLKAAEAQYKDTVDGQPIGGVLGKQMKVYDAQAKGFKDNALQAATKIMVDTWNIRRQTEESLQTTADSKLYDGNIGNAIAEMFSSVSIPVAPAPTP